MITPLLPPPQHINLEQHCYPNANMSTFIVTNTPATYAADDTHPELTSSLAVQFEGIMSRRLRQSFPQDGCCSQGQCNRQGLRVFRFSQCDPQEAQKNFEILNSMIAATF